MYSIIICGHDDLAESFKKSAKMILGKIQRIFSVCFVPGENLEDIKQRICDIISKNALTDVLILTDLYGGTPYNAATSIASVNLSIEVISGVNLSIIIEAISGQNTNTLSDIVAHIKNIAPDTVKSFRDILSEKAAQKNIDY